MDEINQRVALVTGAAQGIGAAVAEQLAANGFAVVVNHHSDSSAQAAKDLADRLAAAYGVPARAAQCDVADFDAVKQMVAEVKDGFGRIDVLVNNAGITRDGLLMRMKEDQFQAVIDTNLGGAFNCMRHVVPLMTKQRYGRIVNISSVVGVYGNAGQVNYSASKAGIIGMTKSAAKELGSRSITVNAHDRRPRRQRAGGPYRQDRRRPPGPAAGRRQRRGLPCKRGSLLHNRASPGRRRRNFTIIYQRVSIACQSPNRWDGKWMPSTPVG